MNYLSLFDTVYRALTRHWPVSTEENCLFDHRVGNGCEDSARQPERVKRLKSYCKGLRIDRSIVCQAYDAWSHATAGKKNHWRIEEEYGSADNLIDTITNEIETRALTFKPFKCYRRRDHSTGKVRDIAIACVKYQVVSYIVANVLEPFFHSKLGYYQVAGVKGKGQVFAMKAIKKWSKEPGYHVKLDVRKCYQHITCDLCLSIIKRYIKSDDVVYIIERLLASCEKGTLEIGTYFSLMMANLVLSYAYHYIEGLYKERRGSRKNLVTHQAWHMDDALLMSRDKRDLKLAIRQLTAFMKRHLGLELKDWKIKFISLREPLDIAGFRACNGLVTLRKGLFLSTRRSFIRFVKRFGLRLARRLVSYWGWLTHSDAQEFIDRISGGSIVALAKKVISRAMKEVKECTKIVPMSNRHPSASPA